MKRIFSILAAAALCGQPAVSPAMPGGHHGHGSSLENSLVSSHAGAVNEAIAVAKGPPPQKDNTSECLDRAAVIVAGSAVRQEVLMVDALRTEGVAPYVNAQPAKIPASWQSWRNVRTYWDKNIARQCGKYFFSWDNINDTSAGGGRAAIHVYQFVDPAMSNMLPAIRAFADGGGRFSAAGCAVAADFAEITKIPYGRENLDDVFIRTSFRKELARVCSSNMRGYLPALH